MINPARELIPVSDQSVPLVINPVLVRKVVRIMLPLLGQRHAVA